MAIAALEESYLEIFVFAKVGLWREERQTMVCCVANHAYVIARHL